jgi:hypothetical protein
MLAEHVLAALDVAFGRELLTAIANSSPRLSINLLFIIALARYQGQKA